MSISEKIRSLVQKKKRAKPPVAWTPIENPGDIPILHITEPVAEAASDSLPAEERACQDAENKRESIISPQDRGKYKYYVYENIFVCRNSKVYKFKFESYEGNGVWKEVPDMLRCLYDSQYIMDEVTEEKAEELLALEVENAKETGRYGLPTGFHLNPEDRLHQ